jgi:hypothetical protein
MFGSLIKSSMLPLLNKLCGFTADESLSSLQVSFQQNFKQIMAS